MHKNNEERVHRARGCLLGQLAGDSLGSRVEFQTPEMIRNAYPDGVSTLERGGTWNILAGQPTDDSEMALLLARMLIERGTYDVKAALHAYKYWLQSAPFDCGNTIRTALQGMPNALSQANGALMRISPLGIFGAGRNPDQVCRWAAADACLTHPHPVCSQIDCLYVMAVAHAVDSGCSHEALYEKITGWAHEKNMEESVCKVIALAENTPPPDYMHHQGWVITAFHNALWQLLNARDLQTGVIDTVMHGGDTDTNAAICGALLGAVYGEKALPLQWKEAILTCRPEEGNPAVLHPRPPCFWPVDALKLADQLVALPRKSTDQA